MEHNPFVPPFRHELSTDSAGKLGPDHQNTPSRVSSSRRRSPRASLNSLIDELTQVPRDSSTRSPRALNEHSFTGFPFPPQHSPQLNHNTDNVQHQREGNRVRDLPNPPMSPHPSRFPQRQELRRTATILSLLNELSKYREGEEDDEFDIQGNQEDRYRPHHDAIQEIGIAIFERFEDRIKALDCRLLGFHNAVQHLASSVGLLSSASHLRVRLVRVLLVLRENAAQLFPNIRSDAQDPPMRMSLESRMSITSIPLDPTRAVIDLETMPAELELLAIDLNGFLECINQISEFADEAVNTSVMSFINDIVYWASCLKEFKGQFRTQSIASHVHELTEVMGEHIDAITDALATFVDVGVPTIRLAQQQKGSAFLNLSTVSTLFSAVTATTIQYSYQANSNKLERNVNGLWIVSLVFSLAGAINSQLAYAWHTDVYRSPKARVPWWGSVMINRAPLCFLIGSVIAFSAGLVCFTFANFAGTAIPIVITVCTSVSSFTLLIVTSWFAGERLAFRYSNGEMWFSDVIKNVLPTAKLIASWCWIQTIAVRWSQSFRLWVQQTSRRFLHSLSSWRHDQIIGDVRDVEARLSRLPNRTSGSKPIRSSQRSSSMPFVPMGGRNPLLVVTSSSGNIFSSEQGRKVVPRLALPISAIIPALRHLAPSTYLHEHPSPIRHLAFSPNGEFLASCSWDKATIIWKVGNPFQIHRRLEHMTGVAGQVAWSPNGRLLLTKLHKSIRIWDAMLGTCEGSAEKDQIIQSIAWMPRGNSFISVEDRGLSVYDLHGNLLSSHILDRMLIHDVAATNDEIRILAVATLEKTTDGLVPSKSEPERRIFVFNLVSDAIEDQIPLAHQVKHVALSSNNSFGIVTFRDQTPPQLIRLIMDASGGRARLSPGLTYFASAPSTFVGPSTLGGFTGTTAEDKMIVSAGKTGEVYIWDRETARLLHSPRTKDYGSDLTAVAWNHECTTSLMFATGSYDGSIRIWTAPLPQDIKPDPPEQTTKE